MAKRRMRFLTWAKKDPNDETPIHYTFRMKDSADGAEYVKKFTSEDTCYFSFMEKLRSAWVEKIEKVSTDTGDYWDAFLYEE